MIVFPNCKINLGLHILRRRSDGYHDLETVFYPLPLHDALEVVPHPAPVTDVAFSASGLELKGGLSDNSCIKAYHLLKQNFPQLPPVQMHLHKTIPLGAGLAGGSADGAFALQLLNKKFNLGLSEENLRQYALQIGSDCPFFIKNTPCYATGRGEVLAEIPVDLSSYTIMLVNPRIHVATGKAFSQLTLLSGSPALKTVIQQPVSEWKTALRNDFEAPVGRQHPQIAEIKAALYRAGAVYASMSGSGSTVYGLFPKGATPDLSFPPSYFVKSFEAGTR